MCFLCFRFARLTRLRLPGGEYVFLEWHDYLGPTFYRDRAGNRQLDINDVTGPQFEAFDWWHSRGKRG